MSDYDCLLAAMDALPDDDAPRLACADWCQEHGDPDRADLIRVQVELADYGWWDRPDLVDRQRALLAAAGPAWRAALPAGRGIHYGFERGFPVLVAVNASAAAAHLRQHPLPPRPRRLRLDGVWGILTLARQPELRHVRYLDLEGARVTRPHTARALRESPNLTGLVGLSLRRTRAEPAAAEAVARNPALAGLRALDLSFNHALARPDVPGTVLAARPALADLDLSGVSPAPATAAAWAADPRFGRLTCLRLSYNRLGDAGTMALAAGPHLAGLRRLELRENGIGPVGATALADSPHLGSLAVLDLRGNPVPPAAAARLRARFGLAVRLTER